MTFCLVVRTYWNYLSIWSNGRFNDGVVLIITIYLMKITLHTQSATKLRSVVITKSEPKHSVSTTKPQSGQLKNFVVKLINPVKFPC